LEFGMTQASGFVLLMSKSDEVCDRVAGTAVSLGASCLTLDRCLTSYLAAPGLLAAVCDVDSNAAAERAWLVVSQLRRNRATANTPVVLRYDRGHEIESALLEGLDPIRSVAAERGVDSLCHILGEVLSTEGAASRIPC
jgi:hypothetical protein